MLFCEFLAIFSVGLVAYLWKQPLLFPRLSPTVFTFFRPP